MYGRCIWDTPSYVGQKDVAICMGHHLSGQNWANVDVCIGPVSGQKGPIVGVYMGSVAKVTIVVELV